MENSRRFLLATLLLMVASCKPTNEFVAPKGAVPTRSSLPGDPYGGYAYLRTRDGTGYFGELVGVRHDTVVVLNARPNLIPLDQVTTGKLVMCNRNAAALPGLVLMIPNVLLLIHSGTYGEGPVTYMAVLTAIDALGMIPMVLAESSIETVCEWSDRKKFLKYARFPAGVPEGVDLSHLKVRPELVRPNAALTSVH